MSAIKAIKINFPKDTQYNTAQKRLKFVRNFGVPLKNQHKTPNFYKYILGHPNKNKKTVRKVIEGVTIYFEI